MFKVEHGVKGSNEMFLRPHNWIKTVIKKQIVSFESRTRQTFIYQHFSHSKNCSIIGYIFF